MQTGCRPFLDFNVTARFRYSTVAGGKSAAIAYTLIETCKLNHVNPEAWLVWVLKRIQDHPANRIGELLPWEYQPIVDAQKAEAEAQNGA